MTVRSNVVLAAALTALLPGAAAAESCFRIGAAQFIDAMSYCVSSVLAPQSGNNYGPENLWDGDDRTAWCEGAAGTTGEYLRINVQGGPEFRRLWFDNGYAKSEKAFYRNARPRLIEITTDTGYRGQYQLPDRSVEYAIDLPQPAYREVLIRILDVYPGTHYRDTCLNGVFVDFEYEEMLLQQSGAGQKNGNVPLFVETRLSGAA
ncbi:MAG: hypothetical protein GY717_03020 [Rhodobacteraceae bacterium]|nr:hypothetical protein [Paracoccaceae bacterium]